MSSFALLTLLHGHSNSMGKVPEIRFHYPPQAGREQELFAKAIEILETYNFQTSFHWALVNEENFPRFKESLQTSISNSELVKIPTLVMHGVIDFDICLRLNEFQQNDKEKLLDIILQADVPPSKEALDFTFRHRKEMAEAFNIPLESKEIQAETRAAFSKNLSFYAEANG